jgi:hypothetical protein
MRKMEGQAYLMNYAQHRFQNDVRYKVGAAKALKFMFLQACTEI